MKQSRKKTRSSNHSWKKQNDVVSKNNSSSSNKIEGEIDDEKSSTIINNLVEMFSSISVEEVVAAYKLADGDENKAVDILTEKTYGVDSYEASCSSFGTDTNSSRNLSSSDGFTDSSGGSNSGDGDECRRFGGNKGKRVVAVSGTVSNLLGKDYVSSKKGAVKEREFGFGVGVGKGKGVEESEQFLYSMLGDDCDLGMAVVKDVLCNCGYNVEKALEVLLDLSAPSCEPSASDKCSSFSSNSEISRNMDFSDNFWQLTDRGSDSNSYSSESDIQENMHFFNYTGRNYADALLSSESSRKLVSQSPRTNGDELPQQLLESLFNMPKSAEHKSAEHELSTMNWRNVVKQMESFAQKRIELGPSDPLPPKMINQAIAKGTEYQMFRGTAQHQWDKTKFCYHKAASAFSNGEKNYATYMSEQGKLYSKMARQADEKASMEIFKARNKGIENSLTIDLHGQHVKQAMKVVKLHLLFSTYISSVQYIRVITGCGSRGLGKSVVKQSVTNLLDRERVPWREENQGTVVIKLDGPREFSFLDSDSDNET